MNISKTQGLVILNFNDSKTVINLMNRIAKMDYFDHIVIVDNMSTDNSFERLKSTNFNNTDIISTSKNGGYSFGNNYGIEYLRKNHKIDYIFISNPDVIFSITNCKNMIKALKKNINIGCVSPVMLNKEKQVWSPYWKQPTFKDDSVNLFILFRKIYKKNFIIDYSKENMPVDVLPGSFFAFKASILKENEKLFNENIFLYCEERILADLIKEKGLQNYLITNDSFIHNHSVSINKSYNELSKYKLLLDSRKIYWGEIKKISKFKLFWYNIFSKYSIFEMRIICFIKKIIKK